MTKKKHEAKKGGKFNPTQKIDKGSRDETGARTATLKMELPGMSIKVPELHKEAEYAAKQFQDLDLAKNRYEKAASVVKKLMVEHKVPELGVKISADSRVIFRLSTPKTEPSIKATFYQPQD